MIKLSFVTFVEIHFCEFSKNCYNYAACKRALLSTLYFPTLLRCITYASRKVPFRKVPSLLFETYKQKLLMCFLQCHVSLMRCHVMSLHVHLHSSLEQMFRTFFVSSGGWWVLKNLTLLLETSHWPTHSFFVSHPRGITGSQTINPADGN